MDPELCPTSSAADSSATTRREFVKSSLLACASGVVAAQSMAPAAAIAADSRSVATTAAPGEGSYPLVPYGSGEPIYLADFARCEPASALTREWEPKHWKLMSYEAEGLSGTLLSAGQNSAAPDVVYPIEQRGWFAVHFGLMSKYGESR